MLDNKNCRKNNCVVTKEKVIHNNGTGHAYSLRPDNGKFNSPPISGLSGTSSSTTNKNNKKKKNK